MVQAIPIYAMGCFKPLLSLCNQLETLMAHFSWGFSKTGTKVHWKNGRMLCKSKQDGGLGFRLFIHLNQVMLAKQA